MGKEIERKFLVIDDSWRRDVVRSEVIAQGYIAHAANCAVRIRISGQTAWLTVKGKALNITRSEYEYPIPVDDARKMLAEFAPRKRVAKTRHFLKIDGWEWVVDDFHDANRGLVMAEVELPDEHAAIATPAWIGREVSTDRRFTNAYLAECPYTQWKPSVP